MKLVGVVTVAALGVGAVLAGWAATSRTDTPAAGPGPAAPAAGKIPPVRMTAVGQDVRYLDEKGKIRRLGVEDFPR
jgi:hypothetical protein